MKKFIFSLIILTFWVRTVSADVTAEAKAEEIGKSKSTEIRETIKNVKQIAVFVDQSKDLFPDYIQKGVQGIAGTVINAGTLTGGVLDIIEKGQIKKLNQMSECYKRLEKKGMTIEDVCKELGCPSKRACMANILGTGMEISEPFFHSLLGEIEIKREKGKVVKRTLRKGLILTFFDVIGMAVEKIGESKEKKDKLGAKGRENFKKFKEKFEKSQKLVLGVVTVLDSLLTLMPSVLAIVGGPDYLGTLPEVTKAQESAMLESDLDFDPDFDFDVD